MREKISKARMRTPIAAVLAASLTAISAAQAARTDMKEQHPPPAKRGEGGVGGTMNK